MENGQRIVTIAERVPEILAGRELPSARIALLQSEGLVAPIGNSRLRATASGMIVLDAVVADLAR